MSKPKKVVVVDDPEEPIEKAVLATAIRGISIGLTKLLGQGLNEKAVVCLLHEFTLVGKPDIRAVLAGLKNLESEYCRLPITRRT